MSNYLIDKLKTSKKGDSFRNADSPNKYNDRIAQLNGLGDNQYQRLNTATINTLGKMNGEPASSKDGTLPKG